MVHADGLWANNLDSSISEVISDHPELFDRFTWVLITSLDSLRELKKDSMIQRLELAHRFIGDGLCVAGRSMRQLNLKEGMLSGFDELWCFSGEIQKPKPADINLVGPLQITTEIPLAASQWMRDSGCILGLGDGTGLNYLTSDYKIAKLLDNNEDKP